MALTLDAIGSVTALTIADSACVEADGTYALIFTGANTTAATGTYTILGNVITAVSLTAGGSGYSAAPTVATQTGDGSITATFLSLATAQDSQTRHPLVEIKSSQRRYDIPFDGSFLTPETFNEYGVNLIPHSSGRLAIAYCYGPDGDGDCGIKYVYTDTDRTEFTTVTIELYTSTNYAMVGVSLCEMSNGNIGLVYLVNDSATHKYRLLRRIITATGVAVSNAEIANWSHDTFTSDPWVTTLDTNSYLMVYGKKSGTNYFLYTRTSSDFITWSAESVMQVDADNKGVGLLTITDSACVEDTGTYALIFTGANVTPAVGTYTVGRYVSALTIVDQLCTEANGAHDLIFTGDNTTTAIGTYTITRYVSALNIVTAACTAADGTYNLIFTGTYTTKAAGTYTVVSNTITAVNLTNAGAGYVTAPTVATQSGHGGSITADILPKIVSTSIINGGSGYAAAPTVATQTGEGTITATVLPIIESTVITDKGSGYIVNPTCVTQTGDGAIRADISAKRLANPSILKISTGELWLWFDVLEASGPTGEELTNLYYATSSDLGVSWTYGTKMTAYDAYSEVATHPIAIQKAANQMNLIFTRKVGALHMDDTAPGWPTGDSSYELSWDSTNRMLYVINHKSLANAFQNVTRVNIDTWTVDKYWDYDTSPAFPACYKTLDMWKTRCLHDGHHIVVFSASASANKRVLTHLDGENDTITNYYFDTITSLNITANVTNHPAGGSSGAELGCIQVDIANNRILLTFNSQYKLYIGYLDLTETSDYEYHEIVPEYGGLSELDLYCLSYSYGSNGVCQGGMHYDASTNYIVLTGGTAVNYPSWINGFCTIFDATSGNLIKQWRSDVTADQLTFPVKGLRQPFVHNGLIYSGMFGYSSGYGQQNWRGLVEIDPVSYIINYYRPSYVELDDYEFGRPFYLQDDKIAMVHLGYGVAVFDTISKTWELFGNSNIAGFTARGDELSIPTWIQYDDVNDLIMVGDPGYGIIMFSIHGYIRQSYYSIGTFSGGAWTFADAAALVQGYLDYDAGACPEPGSTTAMYCFWTSEDAEGEKSIQWDKDGSIVDITDYITGEVEMERTVSGQPATLSFSVSHGHLFDPFNLQSLLSIVLKKGRRITLRWGEDINGTEYWQNAGQFYVTDTSMDFQRGEYPTMKVNCEDLRCIWQQSHVYATELYTATAPEAILLDILETNAGLAAAEISIPTFDNTNLIEIQWIDTDIDDIISQIVERYSYYFRFDVDGLATCKKINPVTSATVDHVYSDNTKLLKYSPDDKYSNFTNRVTVKGKETSYTQVTFADERVAVVSGSVGWWGCAKEHKVWFSDDQSRRVVNPRMVALETSTCIGFTLAGGVSEYLTPCGTADDNKFCTVNVEAPNLIVPFIANLSAYTAFAVSPDLVEAVGFIENFGFTISVGRVVQTAAMVLCMNILASIANYQIEVWGQPLGSIQRTVQGQWNDLEHQTEICAIVEQVIDDPLCQSAADCIEVATAEGNVVAAQRRRVTIEKIAHLQDEDGDTIQVVHPYSGRVMTLFIASLKRSYQKQSAANDSGHFTDTIEGWVIQ